VTRILAEFREKLEPFYSEVGRAFDRPRADHPDAHRRLLLRHSLREEAVRGGSSCTSPIVGSAASILTTRFPDHSTFSVNRHGRFRDSDLFRQVFEAVVAGMHGRGLVQR